MPMTIMNQTSGLLVAAAFLVAWLLVAVQLWIALRYASFVPVLAVGIGSTFFAVVATSAKVGAFLPWQIPVNQLAATRSVHGRRWSWAAPAGASCSPRSCGGWSSAKRWHDAPGRATGYSRQASPANHNQASFGSQPGSPASGRTPKFIFHMPTAYATLHGRGVAFDKAKFDGLYPCRPTCRVKVAAFSFNMWPCVSRYVIPL